jgi:hypothetical protein
LRYRRADQLAGQLAKLNRLPDGTGDWQRTRFVLKELADLSEAMRSNPLDALSDAATRGYARLGHSMVLRDGNRVHTVGIRATRNYLANQYNYTVRPPIGSVPKADADRLFALFDEGTDFVLDVDGETWVYKGTLRYGVLKRGGVLANEQHRIAHLLHHTIDDAARVNRAQGPHGVFTVSKEQIFDLLYDVRILGTPDAKGIEYEFSSFVGKANNTPGSPNGLPLIQYQQTRRVRLGSPNGVDVLTGFPKN